jgi:hypothetical protein
MKKTTTTLLATGALILGVATAQAQFTYVDAIDYSLHPDGPLGNPFALSLENTWVKDSGGVLTPGALANAWNTDASGTGNLWRFRNTGPANVASGTNAYEGRLGDDEVFTVVGGLNPGDTYTIMLYGVWTTRNATWGLAHSFDEGATWSGNIDSLDVDFAKGLGFGQGWVDASGNPISVVYGDAPDTRGAVIIGTTQVNPDGNLIVGVRAAPNTVSERGVFDGIGFAPGVVPEPTTFALTGLGAAALLIFRRRR